MQHFIRQAKQSNNCIKKQLCNLFSNKLSLAHVTSHNSDKAEQPFSACHTLAYTNIQHALSSTTTLTS